jgi:redox-sensing transcriptional repressor
MAGQHQQTMRVRPLTELEAIVREDGARIGVIATPGAAAQYVCDRLVQAGVRSILNFAPVTLAVPQDVEIRQVDLAVELQILAFHEQRRTVTIPECSA